MTDPHTSGAARTVIKLSDGTETTYDIAPLYTEFAYIRAMVDLTGGDCPVIEFDEPAAIVCRVLDYDAALPPSADWGTMFTFADYLGGDTVTAHLIDTIGAYSVAGYLCMRTALSALLKCPRFAPQLAYEINSRINSRRCDDLCDLLAYIAEMPPENFIVLAGYLHKWMYSEILFALAYVNCGESTEYMRIHVVAHTLALIYQLYDPHIIVPITHVIQLLPTCMNDPVLHVLVRSRKLTLGLQSGALEYILGERSDRPSP